MLTARCQGSRLALGDPDPRRWAVAGACLSSSHSEIRGRGAQPSQGGPSAQRPSQSVTTSPDRGPLPVPPRLPLLRPTASPGDTVGQPWVRWPLMAYARGSGSEGPGAQLPPETEERPTWLHAGPAGGLGAPLAQPQALAHLLHQGTVCDGRMRAVRARPRLSASPVIDGATAALQGPSAQISWGAGEAQPAVMEGLSAALALRRSQRLICPGPEMGRPCLQPWLPPGQETDASGARWPSPGCAPAAGARAPPCPPSSSHGPATR